MKVWGDSRADWKNLKIMCACFRVFAFAMVQVPLLGNLGIVILIALLLAQAAMCLGLLISSQARTQFEALQMSFAFFLPVLLLSGILWPYQVDPRNITCMQHSSMYKSTPVIGCVEQGIPWGLRWLTFVMPTYWASEAFRSVMLRGWGFAHGQVSLRSSILLLYTFV
jgi:ABC-type multidrug transport system permease subunit